VYDPLARPLASARTVICFGEEGPVIHAALTRLDLPCILVDTMAEALSVAVGRARSGDAILLSPACASFDAFQNFEHRGHVFRQLALHC
jgi:UDP-N-acetylmuramoylalanine--D-glutamate ligase